MSSSSLDEIVPEVAQAAKILSDLMAAAYVDRLTTLLNGVALARFERAKERSHAFGAVFVDLTGFKAINDAHGHEAGDAALRSAGTMLAGVADQHGAYVFRKSGDEFVILTKRHDAARACAQAVADGFSSGIPFTYEDKPLRILGAVGFSLRQDNEATLSTLISQADEACRMAKDRGSKAPIEWTVGSPGQEVISKRRRCSQCHATTSLQTSAANWQTEALRRCANCGADLHDSESDGNTRD